MPAPKGEYRPRSGPLAGETFPSYYQYQQARSREKGLGSYSAERNRAAALQGWDSEYRRIRADSEARDAHAKALGYRSDSDLKAAIRDHKSFLHALIETHEKKKGAPTAEAARRGLRLNAEVREARARGDRGNRQGSSLDKLLKWSGRKREDDRQKPGDTPKPKKARR